jgi:hypothetical protein
VSGASRSLGNGRRAVPGAEQYFFGPVVRRTARFSRPQPSTGCGGDMSTSQNGSPTRHYLRIVVSFSDLIKIPLLSPGRRNRVRKLSPRSQNRGVKHLPGSHRHGNRAVVTWLVTGS